MPSSVPLAAIRILRPLQGHRPLSSNNLAALSNIQQAEEEHDRALQSGPTDPITLSNECDRTKSVEDLRDQLLKADFTDIEIVHVSLRTIVEVSDALAKEMKTYNDRGQELVVFQLCDGTELDGYPGVSMIHELEKRKIPFTGSDSAFYIISSSKPILKRELQKANVPTSSFEEFIDPPKMTDLDNIIREIGFPMIVKPSISYASINISMKSVVHTPDELLEQVNLSLSASKSGAKLTGQVLTERTDEQNKQDQRMAKLLKKEQKMEIDIETPTVFVERYLAGREFTALVVGDKDWGVRVYPVAERAFDPKLGKFERLLSFDQYWDGYNLEGGSGNEEFCKYQMANGAWQDHLQQVAKDAYLALDGNGYGRVDIRTVEMDTCEPVVLEVNANCGLSFEKDSSSLANILLMTNVSPPGFVRDLIDNAIHRNYRLNHLASHKLFTPHRAGVTAVHASTARHVHEVLVQS
ncbi:hypothetical protein KI688_008593 [Linnemannia hyalina]|uniref:ATP-grasp domain-containing protein n=1 Tax=Linnemannia hyalina TaxID=64524 RepID=A0A9P8BWM1_9FUNG|nr:hypothetical protein KI688_008593 [Linnemannia hyalina]